MKIAIALFFKAPLGGLQDNIYDTAVNLQKNGHEVTVLSPPGAFQDILTENGVPVANLSASLTNDSKYDLIHAHPGESRTLAQRMAKSLSIPLFITFHGRWIDGIHQYYQDCAKILAVSPAVRELIIASAPQSTDRIEILPNAVDLERISPPVKHRADVGPIHILVPSRFDADKSPLVETLMAVWEEQVRRGIATIRWEIAGDGTRHTELVESSRRIFAGEMPVRFHGWLDKTKLNSLYERCDVAVAPGRSAMAAMAKGLPVIPLGSAGCFGLATKDLLPDAAYSNFGGYGLTNVATPAQVIGDLEKLASAPPLRAELGRASQVFIQDYFNLAFHHRRLEEFYLAAIRASRGGSD